MKFGRIQPQLLSTTGMDLPAEPALNVQVLGSIASKGPQIYLGCTQWKCDAWMGKIYPKGMRDSEILDAYLRQFNSIELNATHYRIFPPEVVSKWASKASGTDFKFCPKFPQSISHYSQLTNATLQTQQFMESIMQLGEHLGPSFLQLSESFAQERLQTLLQYFSSLPSGMPFFVELRHPLWYEKVQQEKTAQLLHEQGIGWVITDAPGRRDVCHMHLTTKTAFIRFLGNNLHPTDYTRIDAWIQRIKYWLDNGLEELYFFMHHPDEDGAPELIDYMAQRLQLQSGISIKRPVFLPRQTSLF